MLGGLIDLTAFLVTSRLINTLVFGRVMRKQETFSLVYRGKTNKYGAGGGGKSKEIWWWW